MVHQAHNDNETASVPEELYNLTQLANVTLAAGKLCTVEPENHIDDVHPELDYRSYTLDVDKTLVDPVITQPARCIKNPQTPFSKYRNIQNESVNRGNESTASPSQKPSSFISDEDYSDTTLSTKNYAHKIFDKRKARKLSYQSDDSAEFEAQRLGRFLETQTASANRGIANYHHLSMNDSYALSCDEATEDGIEFGEVLSGGDGDEGDIHNCPECGKKYSTSSNLARHRQTHRSLMDKKARRCPHCDKVYVSMPAFSMHVRTHNQGCECPHCGKRFSRPWLLQGHIRTHTGEKPFECSICAKAFADKSNLRAHIQTHSNTKPHSCTRCGKSFALKSYLYKHEESSCIRSQGCKSNDKESKPKANRSDSSYSSSSSNSSQTSSSHKITKQRTKSSNSELHKRFKEKLRDKLRAAKDGVDDSKHLMPMDFQTHNYLDEHRRYQQDIVMDSGSQKSYIQLMNPVIGETPKHVSNSDYAQSMPYSRCSVIRTTVTSPMSNHSAHECPMDDHSVEVTGFYDQQESPVDFSPQSKFAQNNNSRSNGFEIVRRSYMMVA